MEIIVDECIAESTKKVLENLGFKVILINSILYHGVEDKKIYEYASKNQISLLTHDKRFGYIYFESTEKPTTTIILQMVSPHPDATNKLLQKALLNIDFSSKHYSGKLIIISPSKIRIRAKTFKKT